jgi:hypothetical protein
MSITRRTIYRRGNGWTVPKRLESPGIGNQGCMKEKAALRDQGAAEFREETSEMMRD